LPQFAKDWAIEARRQSAEEIRGDEMALGDGGEKKDGNDSSPR
jgi:hypothetical protein